MKCRGQMDGCFSNFLSCMADPFSNRAAIITPKFQVKDIVVTECKNGRA